MNQNLTPPEENKYICSNCGGKGYQLIDEANAELVESLEQAIEVINCEPIHKQSRHVRTVVVRCERAIKEVVDNCETCESTGELSEDVYLDLLGDG